jgi:hypothetical protein
MQHAPQFEIPWDSHINTVRSVAKESQHLPCPPPHLQAFHTLYHTDENVLLGAPTGSGKTISSELTMLRVFNEHPGEACWAWQTPCCGYFRCLLG